METSFTLDALRTSLSLDDDYYQFSAHDAETSQMVVDAPGTKVRLTGRMDFEDEDFVKTIAFLEPKAAKELSRMLKEYAEIAAENQDSSESLD